MNKTSFWKAGHTPTLFASFFYFDLSFMVWVILGPLAVQISKDIGLTPAEKGLMVATPLLAGALLRIVMGVLVDHLKPKKAGMIGQVVVMLGLLWAWLGSLQTPSSLLAVDPVMAGYFTAGCVLAGSIVRPLGGRLADSVGGIKTLSMMYAVAAAALFVASLGMGSPLAAAMVFVVAMLALGTGNGAVFQLVPQRFRKEIGVMTGLVGMAGGIGGFYLASSLGLSKQWTGSYQAGLLIFASLAVYALVGLSFVKNPWRTTWGSAAVTTARI